MTPPTLVILAAGMGSRYGGLKQLDPLGPHGENIIDYSLYDARKVGFGRIVFVIRPEHLADFRVRFDALAGDGFAIDYAFQRPDDLPGGFLCPPGRIKPWGTGHAVYCARGLLNGPFGVIGADDFYGRETFVRLHGFLTEEAGPRHWGMVAHRLKHTLPPEGSVSRGVCRAEGGMLVGVTERTAIRRGGYAIYYEEAGQRHSLDPETLVSMIVWGLHPAAFAPMEADFLAFLEAPGGDPLTREYYLPAFIDRMVGGGQAGMRVLETPERWYGVTYRQDREAVMAALAALHGEGVYPKLK